MAEEVFDIRELTELILQGVTRSNSAGDGSGTSILVRDDGTVIIYNRLIGAAPLGEQQISVETAGEVRVVNMGWDGSAIIRLLTESDGTLRTTARVWNGSALTLPLSEVDGSTRSSLVGTDEAGNEDSMRTDPNRIPWTRAFNGYLQVDPVEIPNTEGVLWSPGSNAAELYEVSFLVVNNDAGAAAATCQIGVDIAAGGSLAAPEFWLFNTIIAAAGTSGWQGPFLIAGDDDVRGSASVANDLSIHFRNRRVDVGA